MAIFRDFGTIESDVHGDVLEAAKLVKGDWPYLSSLSLYECAIDAAGISLTVEVSNWPQSAFLTLSS